MSRLVTDIRTDEHVNILLWFCEQNSQYLWYMIKGRVQKKVWSFVKPPSTSLAARLESKSVCVAYVTQRIFWRCIVSIREWADSFLIAVSLALRVLKENGAAIWPHRKSGGPWRLHETLHRGKCRGYHGASGQCLPSLPQKIKNSQDPTFRYESTSQPKHDGVWTTFTINRYLFHIVRSLQGYQGPGIYLHFSSGREQFPGFYAQFRELNKAIGASGDGDLEYIYDNLMITEVNILYILYYILYICYILLYTIFDILHMSQSKIIP